MNSSKRGGRSLSYRLEKIKSFYSGQNHIWDIGCDHGHLGLSFLEIDSIDGIYLVDPSEEVIKELKVSIDSYITRSKMINVIHKRGQDLKIEVKNNSIFIAGMGGKEIGEILTHLLPQVDSSTEFIVSPHRKILELRALLGTLNIHLKSEELIYENGQYYQILVLRPGSGRAVGPFGELFWETPLGKQYLEHQKRYFSQHRDDESQRYLSFLLSL